MKSLMIKHLFSLAIISVFALPSTTEAADVWMYGIKISQGDYIGGGLVSARGTTAIIDLGYIHGVSASNRFWVFRDRGNGYERICDLQIIRSDRKTSIGRATLNFAIKPLDMFVINASRLDLWTSRSRNEEELISRLTIQQRTGKYDTRDTLTTTDDLFETPRNSSLRFIDWKKFIANVRPKRRAYIDLKQLREKLRYRSSLNALEIQGDKLVNSFVVGLNIPKGNGSRRNAAEDPTVVKPALDRLKSIRQDLKGKNLEVEEEPAETEEE